MAMTSSANMHQHCKDLAHSANGRVSAKSWKSATLSTSRTHPAHRSPWHTRMEKTERQHAIKKLESELKQEKHAERQRKRETTLQRQRAAEERRRLEQERATMGAKKSARLRRRAGRTKKING